MIKKKIPCGHNIFFASIQYEFFKNCLSLSPCIYLALTCRHVSFSQTIPLFFIHISTYTSLHCLPNIMPLLLPIPCTFMATVSLTSTDLSCPFSSKKTSLWPALFRSPSASALMWRVFPLSSSTWDEKKKRPQRGRRRIWTSVEDTGENGKGGRMWKRNGLKLN